MPSVFAAGIAELPRFHAVGVLLFVFGRCVIAVFAIAALQRNDFTHNLSPFPELFAQLIYSTISVTAPAPTV
jgi:hypothetical protein